MIPVYFLVNEFDARISLHSKFVESMKRTFKDRLLEARLHSRISYAEVTHEGKGVYEYSDAKAKKEITLLVNELLQKIKSLK